MCLYHSLTLLALCLAPLHSGEGEERVLEDCGVSKSLDRCSDHDTMQIVLACSNCSESSTRALHKENIATRVCQVYLVPCASLLRGTFTQTGAFIQPPPKALSAFISTCLRSTDSGLLTRLCSLKGRMCCTL